MKNDSFIKHSSAPILWCCSYLICLLFTSCDNDMAEVNFSNMKSNTTYVNVTGSDATKFPNHPAPSTSYPFFFQATGPFTISPVSATVVKIDQEMFITSASPFALSHGFVQGYDDLTISTFPDRFFNGSFIFSGQGNDSLFATLTVQTSIFSDPVDPESGDFFGSEDFTGTYQVTSGTGRYLNASWSGEYVAHSEWHPPTIEGTFFSGFTTVTATGTIWVVARNGQLERLRESNR